jgi:hypothetical protein
MITDDPGTPGNRKWEVNVTYNTERSPGIVQSGVPNFDINYGYGDRIELTVEFPYLMTNSADGGRKQGMGDTLVGVKWRFVDWGDGKLNVSTYPQYTFNTLSQSVHSGLVDPDANLFLPLEASQTLGPFEVNVDAGVAFHREEPDEFSCGVAIGHEFEHGLETIVEYRSDRELDSDQDQQLVNFGVRKRINALMTFIGSYGLQLGHASAGNRPWIGSVGLQFTF